MSNCKVDPETAQWIEEYNELNGVSRDDDNGQSEKSTANFGTVLIVRNAMLFVKLLLASIVLGIYARSYNSKPFGIDLIVYSSFLVTALGMTLLVCLWFKCQEQADLETDD